MSRSVFTSAVFIVIVVGSILSVGLLWWTNWPLGVPGEWTWNRVAPQSDTLMNLVVLLAVGSLYVCVVWGGWFRFQNESKPLSRFETLAWMIVLVGMSFSWIWLLQECSPATNSLGKCPFVLYYPSSSGYFTKARYDSPDARPFLRDYEKLMEKGDVLHEGTHPPGLTLVFHGLIAVCKRSAALAGILERTMPASFNEGCDVIATNVVKSRLPRSLTRLDRQVLWLATLIVMMAAAFVVIPLFGVTARTSGIASGWLAASLWPTLPAISIFTPKSDVAYCLYRPIDRLDVDVFHR